MAKRPSQADFDRVAETARRAINEATDQYEVGEIDADRWGEKVNAILVNRHAQARTLGRKRGGDLAMFDDGDREYGRLMAARDKPYLDKYVAAMKEGRYRNADGTLKRAAMDRRNEMYVDKLRGTANRAIARASDGDTVFEWKLGEADHCFPAAVEIYTPNGRKRIADIKPGDLVITLHGPKEVSATFFRDYWSEYIRIGTTHNETICTLDHPFLTQRGWVRAKDLTLDDYAVIYEYGSEVIDRILYQKLHSIERTNRVNEKVYNLAVEDVHQYIANGFVVHNCDDCLRWSEESPFTADTLPAYPGDGTSQCRTACACSLKRSDGVREFVPA